MGVPGFFAWLLRKYNSKRIIKDLDDKNVEIYDILYLDANCLFHPQCFAVLEEHAGKDVSKVKLESLMISRIIDYIDFIINKLSISFLFIAVDGVAPLAKINQQRLRRFKSFYENEIKFALKSKYNIPYYKNWTNSCISPGTPFMKKLDKKLKKYLTTLPIPHFYSSWEERGEGEHKILQHIKGGEYGRILIYGLDADLIFLALALRRPNIFLLREDMFEDTGGFKIVSIDELGIIINSYITKFTNVAIDYIDDFIIICYLLGNDFLPHLPSIDIKNRGMELLISCYIACFKTLGYKLVNAAGVNKGKLNIGFLKHFLKKLAEFEVNYFTKLMPKWAPPERKEPTSYENELYNFENLTDIDYTDPIKLNEPGYKTRYYSYYEMDPNLACKEYLEGIVWCFDYYFDKCPSWTWAYGHTNAPFLSDIAKYLSSHHFTAQFKDEIIITPEMQLLLIMPPQYKGLLKSEFRKYVSSRSPIKDLYPVVIEFDYINKKLFWKVLPKIPVITHLTLKRVAKLF